MSRLPRTLRRAAALLLLPLGLFSRARPALADDGEKVRMEIFEVERSKTLTVPTRGMARVLVLNSAAVETRSISENSVVFAGLYIDSSVVHLWDQDGRRTIRVVVTELKSVLNDSKNRELDAIHRRLGIKDRSLKMQYRGTHRNLERGEKISTRTDEQYRVRTHEWKGRMGTPAGLLVGNAFLEERRDTFLDKEVTQPRHLSMDLQEFSAGPLGKVDLVAGDKDLYLSDFTIPGKRYRGFGVFPSLSNPGEELETREGLALTAFGGEEREGYGLDLQSGYQSKQARSHLAGMMLEHPIFQGFKAHATGLHREGKDGEFKSDHVYEFGFDGSWKDLLRMDVDFARNGPEGAYQADFDVTPNDEWGIHNRFWQVGKNYRTVTGQVSRDGQTGWSNSVRLRPSVWEGLATLTSGVTMYRDRNSLNPDNPREWNTLYTAGLNARLPGDLDLNAGASYDDQSASPFPALIRQGEVNLSRYFTVDWGGISSVTPFVGYRNSDFDKSRDIPGFDGTLGLFRTGARVNFWKGTWAGATWSQGILHEHEPESLPSDSRPKELVLELGKSYLFQKIPANLNLTARWVDVQNTFNKTHQPFTDQNQVSGNAQFTWKLGEDRELFGTASVSRQKPETGGGSPLVEFFTEAGVRLGWDTGWAPSRKGSVSGVVFQDLNANARRDPEEPGIPDVQVYIQDGPSAMTNNHGAYLLRGVQEGAATIRVQWDQIPKGYFFTSANSVEQFILPGQRANVDFGVSTEVEFRGRVYNDVDGDGTFTEGTDAPVQGVRLTLENGSSTGSGPTGHYLLRKIHPGSHTLTVQVTTIPDGYRTMVPVRKSSETVEGDVVPFDILLQAQRTVSGAVFLDANGNGLLDTQENGTPGVLLEMGTLGAATGPDGAYRFNDAPPGAQQVRVVRESLPSGSFLRSPDTVELEIPKGPFNRERVNFILSSEPGPVTPPEPAPVPEPELEPQPEPAPPAEEAPAPEAPYYPEPVEPLAPAAEQAASTGEDLRAALDELLGPSSYPQVVDYALVERYPEIRALAERYPAVVIDRSDTYQQTLDLVMGLVYRSAHRVFYYEQTFRSGWFFRAAAESHLEVLVVQPRPQAASILGQILAYASGLSEDQVSERIDLDALASWLRILR